ncbi:hypothetical protein NHX12_009071, partial [Muraenolepis orangiensis]
YQVGQLYAVAEASKNETGGGEGVSVLINEPYEKDGEKGQYTRKIYYLQSKVPKLIRALAPKGSLEIYEEAWNAYPYCRTILTNTYMGDSFFIKIETWHKPDMGDQENVHGLDEETWKNTEVVHIDIADKSQVGQKDYKPDEDPATFVSKKTGRGPLGPNWKTELKNNPSCPHMCAYKLVTVKFKWKVFEGNVQNLIHKQETRLFTSFHRQLFCWLDRWVDMSMDDIRRMEEETQRELDKVTLIIPDGRAVLHMVTWNVASASPAEDLSSLLRLGSPTSPDLYVIGLQEVSWGPVRLVSDLVFEDPWSLLFMSSLAPLGYMKVSSMRLQGLLILVFSKLDHVPFIRDIQATYTRTGIFGYWGNKGGVSIRMSFYGHMLCFLNCHLAAHMQYAEQRLDEFQRILDTQTFEKPTAGLVLDRQTLAPPTAGLVLDRQTLAPPTAGLVLDTQTLAPPTAGSVLDTQTLAPPTAGSVLDTQTLAPPTVRSVLDHRLVFWFGDLNFRIQDHDMDFVRSCINDQTYHLLWSKDQLTMMKKKEPLLQEFEEGPLDFQPTYKFDRNSDLYDSRPYRTWSVFHGKKRKPAWTDRILQDWYGSDMTYCISDHKPVVGLFAIELKKLQESPLVRLSPEGDWSADTDAMLVYCPSQAFPSSVWDWIGLFKVGFSCVSDYITYTWVKDHQVSFSQEMVQVYFGLWELPAWGGQSVLCYYSSALQCIVGVSEPFKVQVSQVAIEEEGLAPENIPGRTRPDEAVAP